MLKVPEPSVSQEVPSQTDAPIPTPVIQETEAPSDHPDSDVQQAQQAAGRAAEALLKDEAAAVAAQPAPVDHKQTQSAKGDANQHHAAGSGAKGKKGKALTIDTPSQPASAMSSAPSATSGKAAPWAAQQEVSPSVQKSSSGPSIREIQAKEAKEDEIRKAAAKKAKAAALASEQAALAAQAEQEANLPWASAKSPATGGPAWSTPVSTTHANGTKKSLKEIQEEEEGRQKKLAQQRQQTSAAPGGGAGSAPRGGYAGSLGPKVGQVAPSNTTAPSPGPWATVGSNGKASQPTPPPKPVVPGAASRSVSSSAQGKPPVSGVMNGARTPPSTLVAAPSGTSKPSGTGPGASKTVDQKPQPSLEFLNWCRTALQGLSIPSEQHGLGSAEGLQLTGVHAVDEFIAMLLDFPVQADSSTLEIISDAVYSNSRTLDGRRFAEQFALKRKADAGLSTKGKQATVPPAAAIQVGAPTAAQILQSKPKTNEDSFFKVVPKKKKGGK